MMLLTLLILILCVLLLGLPFNGAFPWFWLLAPGSLRLFGRRWHLSGVDTTDKKSA